MVAGEVEVVAVVEVEARPRSLPRHEQRGEAAAAAGVVAEVGVGVAEKHISSVPVLNRTSFLRLTASY